MENRGCCFQVYHSQKIRKLQEIAKSLEAITCTCHVEVSAREWGGAGINKCAPTPPATAHLLLPQRACQGWRAGDCYFPPPPEAHPEAGVLGGTDGRRLLAADAGDWVARTDGPGSTSVSQRQVLSI